MKVPTIEETSIALQGAHFNEAGGQIQSLKNIEIALGSVFMGIPALLGGVSGALQELDQDLLRLFSSQYVFLFYITSHS